MLELFVAIYYSPGRRTCPCRKQALCQCSYSWHILSGRKPSV